MSKFLAYMRFGLMTSYLLLAVLVGFFRPDYLWLAFAYGLFMVTFGDEFTGNSRRVYSGVAAGVVDTYLYLTLPLQLILFALVLTFLSPGDPFGLLGLSQAMGGDLAGYKASAGAGTMAIMIGFFGYLFGSAGVNVSHELFHRTKNPFAVAVGRWLLAFTWDTTFAIEHVYGHHRHVGTKDDPATARRGEPLQVFWVRSTVMQVVKAFQHEAQRLRNRGRSVVSLQNRAIRGQFMSLTYVGIAWYAAGWKGVAAMFIMAVIGKLILESVNYIEHYGLVRAPGTKVAPHHSWDSFRLLSNALLYNLPRHSSHHINASLRFWDLDAREDTPTLPYGYMTMIFIAMVPPLWKRIMDPRLQDWEERFATPAERELSQAGVA